MWISGLLLHLSFHLQHIYFLYQKPEVCFKFVKSGYSVPNFKKSIDGVNLT